ncbi:hypothetical protein [Acinetobacter sp.]|uniref:hypothetical protein n=1 Tax=Acinetobacter sp. TaxID=472 RepID=UPI00388F2E38
MKAQEKLFNDLIVQMRKISEMDFEGTANLQFLGHFHREMVSRGTSNETAEIICSRMQLNLPNDTIADEKLAEMAQVYAIIMVKARHALVKVGFKNPTEFLANAASNLTLKLE